jgi:hypothetical protein
MKRRLPFTVALLLTLLSLCSAQAGQERKTEPLGNLGSDHQTRQELLNLLQQWFEARRQGDTAIMDRIMAEEWSLTTAEGKFVTKARSLEGAKAGEWKSYPISLDDTAAQVRVYGEIAVMQLSNPRSRSLLVWVKRDGRWQWVASQQTLVAQQAKQPPQKQP